MKFFKKMAFLAIAVSTIGLASCGGDNAGKIAQEAAQSANILTEDYQRTKSQLQVISQVVVSINDSEEVTVPLTWSADAATASLWDFSEPSSRSIIYCTPTLPAANAEQIPYTLTATATYKGKTASKSFEGVLMPTAPVATRTIKSLSDLDVDDETSVTVRGIIRPNYSGDNGAVVCDSTGCIALYKNTGLDIYDAGQTVIVRGAYSANRKNIIRDTTGSYFDDPLVIPQIVNPTLEIVDGRPQAIPTEGATNTTFADANAFVANNFGTPEFVNRAGGFYKLSAKIIKYSTDDYYVWEFVAPDTDSPYIRFYCNSSVQANLDAQDELLEPYEGKNVTLCVYIHDLNSRVRSGAVVYEWRYVPLFVELAQ